MKIAIIINAERMTAELASAFNNPELELKYQISYDLFVVPPASLIDTINNLNLATYNGILVGGGDGTVRSIAQILIDHEIPLAVLPLGTFNYFAKDLGFTNDLDQVFSVIKNKKTKTVDLAQVNEYIFLNHSWIGFYSYILKEKEKHKNFLGKSKILKIIFTCLNIFKIFPVYHIEIMADGIAKYYQTCLVYISNNENYTDLFAFGERKSLTSGLLAVSILNCQNRWELFICMLTIFFNNFKDSKYVTNFVTNAMSITTKTKLVNVVIDGELFKLENPVNYSMHQHKLLVFSV